MKIKKSIFILMVIVLITILGTVLYKGYSNSRAFLTALRACRARLFCRRALQVLHQQSVSWKVCALL